MPLMRNLLLRVWHRILEIPTRGLPQGTPKDSFDAEHGTNTSGITWWTNPRSDNFASGIRYQPCPPELCRMAIERSGVDPKEFCFLDIGSGKGRALIIASEYGFKDLVGVDYSAKLCRISGAKPPGLWGRAFSGHQRRRDTIRLPTSEHLGFPVSSVPGGCAGNRAGEAADRNIGARTGDCVRRRRRQFDVGAGGVPGEHLRHSRPPDFSLSRSCDCTLTQRSEGLLGHSHLLALFLQAARGSTGLARSAARKKQRSHYRLRSIRFETRQECQIGRESNHQCVCTTGSSIKLA